jgi:ABC-type transport system involved in multi-copper enzyme maturation permease subunit
MIALSYDRQLASYTESQRAREEKLRQATDFRSLRMGGATVERRPNPLSVLAMGLEKEMARSVTISQFQEPRLGRSKYANPLFVLFPAPDLLYIVGIVASLLAVLFAFDAVCGEQEEGTLRLIMANAVPRHLVLLAKWIGGYVTLILPFLAALLTALLFALLTTSLSFSGGEWLALAGMVAVAALYISAFYALSMLVSTLAHRTATSLAVNFLIWVLLVLLVPNTAPIVARAVAPIPAAGVVAGQREAIQRAGRTSMREQMRQARTREERQQLNEQVQAKVRQETDKLMADYLQKVDHQIGLGILLSRVSPSASYVYATAGLAGSGLADFSGLRGYILQYRRDFMEKVQQIWAERQRQAAAATDEAERQEIRDAPIDPKDLPAFAPARPRLAALLTGAQTDLLLLVVVNVGCFLGAYAGFLRYDLMK